jgi:tRNA1(Val) A37 N6-methylase TrmN6
MQKSEKYYSETRPELLAHYPSDIKTLLDIGCSSAAFSSTLKSRSIIEVWGIEMNEASAEIAKKRIDKV